MVSRTRGGPTPKGAASPRDGDFRLDGRPPPLSLKPLKESVIQKQILDWLQSHPGVLAWRELIGGVPIGGGRFVIPNPKKGFPDIAGLFADGRHFALEVKTEDGKVAPHQQKWHEDLARFNCFVRVVRSLAEAKAVMEPEILKALAPAA